MADKNSEWQDSQQEQRENGRQKKREQPTKAASIKASSRMTRTHNENNVQRDDNENESD